MSTGAGLLATPSPGLTGQAHRLLPAGWRGPGRRAAWRRARVRRVVAALLVGLAAWLTLSAFLPQPTVVGVPVVVAAHDLAAGQRLAAGDLRVARWAPGTAPSGAATSTHALAGQRVAAPITTGEAVTASRLHGPGLLTGLGPGQVAARVSVTDERVTAMVHPGDHVAVIDTASGARVGSDLLVLATDAPGRAGGGLVGGTGSAAEDGPPGVVVAVSDGQAAALARAGGSAALGAGVTLTLRAPGD